VKLYLPSSKDKGVFIGLVFLAGVFIIGMCIRINDACSGKLGEWLNSLMNWLIEKQGKRELEKRRSQ
jgi:hypothetical protein